MRAVRRPAGVEDGALDAGKASEPSWPVLALASTAGAVRTACVACWTSCANCLAWPMADCVSARSLALASALAPVCVGMVWVALDGIKKEARCLRLFGTREEVRQRAAQAALDMVRRALATD